MISNFDKAEYVMEALGMVLDACEVIRESGRCDDCPLFCLEEDSLYEVGDSVTKRKWIEFFDYADDIKDCISEADYIADLADMKRKEERDEWYD